MREQIYEYDTSLIPQKHTKVDVRSSVTLRDYVQIEKAGVVYTMANSNSGRLMMAVTGCTTRKDLRYDVGKNRIRCLVTISTQTLCEDTQNL